VKGKIMGKKIITEKEVIMLPHNATLKVEGDYMLTPSARDIVLSRNIKIETTIVEEQTEIPSFVNESELTEVHPNNSSRFIISVFGPEKAGVVSNISSYLAQEGLSIQDISQRIIGRLFTLFMVVDLADKVKEYKRIKQELLELGEKIGVKIYIQHESIFEFMHRI
jgi:ACT domain-containing protein